MKKNNKGYSLFEMLLVMGIIAIMITMITVSIGLIKRTNVNRTSEKLESLVNKARATALTKGSKRGFLNVAYIKNDGYYALIGEEELADSEDNIKKSAENIKKNGEKIAGTDVTISLNGTFDTSKGEQVHSIQFLQSTGGLNGSNIVLVTKNGTSSKFYIYTKTGKTYRSEASAE